VLTVLLTACGLAGCGGVSGTHSSSPPSSAATTTATVGTPASGQQATTTRVSPLHLPLVRSRILPGYLLVADRNNDRVIILSPDKRIVWQRGGLHQPDDAFFTPGFRSVITNEEFDDTLAEVSLRSSQVVWRYGHAGAAGSASGYLDAPDDAYRVRGGITTVADIKNCRIVQVRPSGAVLRVLGGTCTHDPPRGFASPNGDTPLPDGGLLVTEIGGWIDRLDRRGRLVWSVRSPVSYPSDAQLLPDGRILVSGFTTPGRVVEMTRTGKVVWSFGATSGPDRLDRPSLAIRLPNGLVAINDDWRHRVLLVDPRTSRIVWQYGHADVASSAPGYLSKPDGMDFLPAAANPTVTAGTAPTVATTATAPASATSSTTTSRPVSADPASVSASASSSPTRPVTAARRTHVVLTRVGRLPAPTSKLAAAALPDGTIVAAGGLVGGGSSAQVLVGPPDRLRRSGALPASTHDAAAAAVGRSVVLYGGGDATSTAAVVTIDPRSGRARNEHPLDEPLSDLGAVSLGGHVYLVGGYTGSRFATAVLRVGRGNGTTVVARLPVGLRYAGVAVLSGSIYVAGGVSPTGPSRAVYRVDVRTGRVSQIGRLPRPDAHAPLVAARGALWLVGGDGSGDILRIDPVTGAASVAARLPHPLVDAAAVALPGSRVVVLGGDASGDVWSFSPPR
jgi:hypothetical protein